MYVFIVGDRGDGKTLTATRFACQAKKALTNFPVNKKSVKQLKVKHVFNDFNPDARAAKDRWRVNWDWWKNKRGYSVFVDEAYMQFENRSPQDPRNRLWNSWGAQSRKILSNQGKARDLQKIFKMKNNVFMRVFPKYVNSLSNFFMLSQTVRRVDVNQRELVNVLINCQQIEIEGVEYTLSTCWYSDKLNDAIEKMIGGVSPKMFLTRNKDWYGRYDTNYYSREVNIEDGEAFL